MQDLVRALLCDRRAGRGCGRGRIFPKSAKSFSPCRRVLCTLLASDGALESLLSLLPHHFLSSLVSLASKASAHPTSDQGEPGTRSWFQIHLQGRPGVFWQGDLLLMRIILLLACPVCSGPLMRVSHKSYCNNFYLPVFKTCLDRALGLPCPCSGSKEKNKRTICFCAICDGRKAKPGKKET